MRNLGLDLLRALAIVLVLLRHMHEPSKQFQFLEHWKIGGWVGVDLFFVLSGFLVSGLLFKEHLKVGTINIKRFLIRRGLKIYPAFWVFIIFTLVTVKNQPVPIKKILGEIFFLQNYVGCIWGHTWSLAVEEHFYIGIAILFYCLLKFRPEKGFSIIPRLFLIIAIICLGFRMSNYLRFPVITYQEYLYKTHIRIDSLLWGVFLSYHYHYRNLSERIRHIPSKVLIASGVLLLLPAFVYPVSVFKWVSVYGVILFYFGAGFLLLAAIRLEKSSNRLLNLIGILGATSYSIYLWHFPIMQLGLPFVEQYINKDSFIKNFLILFFASIIIGYVMSKLVEWPILRLRNKWFP